MNKNTLARSILCSALLALPVSLVGCIGEFHSDGDSCDDPFSDVVDNPNDDPNDDANDDPNDVGSCPDPGSAIYLSVRQETCDTIDFTCPDTHTAFNASCGCGCDPLPEEEPAVCPTEDGQGITVLSRDLKVCSSITFTCQEGDTQFNGTCGCGCIAAGSQPAPPVCPDRANPKVHYIGDEGSAQCTLVSFQCPAECIQFNDSCGCGCIEP